MIDESEKFITIKCATVKKFDLLDLKIVAAGEMLKTDSISCSNEMKGYMVDEVFVSDARKIPLEIIATILTVQGKTVLHVTTEMITFGKIFKNV